MIKNLKSLFIIEDEKPEKKGGKPTETKKEEPKKSEDKTIPNLSKSEVPLTGGKIDKKITDALFKAFEDNNIQGFDYFEFKQSLNSLVKMVADEPTRYKSAFATASTMGLTLDKLVETAKHYSGILDSERAKFNNAAKTQRTQMVDDRKEESEQLKKTIEAKNARIIELNKEITAHESKLLELEGSINTAVDKIAETQRNFERSFENLKTQIDQDIEKMKKYLK